MPALGTILSTTSVPTSAEFDDHSARHENGGADEISVAGLSGTLADPQTAAAHAASHQDGGADEISIAGLAGTPLDLTAHLTDTADAHDASAVSVVPFATIAATDVQAALEEIVAEVAGGAPTTADYLVGTAQGGLSAEIVVGATPGGELGGTWPAPTVDATHSGSTHAAAQAAAEATAAAALAAHTGDATDAHDASAISYDPTASGMTATEVQAAIDELDAAIGASHDAVTVGTGLDVTGQLVELDLSEVAAGGELAGFLDAPTVDATHSGSTHAAAQAAAEATAAGALSTHAGAVDPHTGYRREDEDHSHASTGAQGGTLAASAIVFTPNGSIAATNVQTAIQEVRDEAGGEQTVYVQDADPGAVGAGKLWIDTTDFPAPPVIRFRSTDDDAWFDLLEQYTGLGEVVLRSPSFVKLQHLDGGDVVRGEVVIDSTQGRIDINARDDVGATIATWEVGEDGFGGSVLDELGQVRAGHLAEAGASGDADAQWEWSVKNAAGVDKAKLVLNETGFHVEAVAASVDIAGDTGDAGDVLTAQGDGTALWAAAGGGAPTWISIARWGL